MDSQLHVIDQLLWKSLEIRNRRPWVASCFQASASPPVAISPDPPSPGRFLLPTTPAAGISWLPAKQRMGTRSKFTINQHRNKSSTQQNNSKTVQYCQKPAQKHHKLVLIQQNRPKLTSTLKKAGPWFFAVGPYSPANLPRSDSTSLPLACRWVKPRKDVTIQGRRAMQMHAVCTSSISFYPKSSKHLPSVISIL